MTHIDLFSGIGGFTLAATWAGFETIVFCEKDKYCQKVLNKHWPDVPIIEDIHEFNGRDYPDTTLLTGGFPCQPFSIAGKRQGKEDDRALWPQMFRVIQESKPTWIVGENVTGFIYMGLDEAIANLEREGYEVITLNIPACACDAPHIRQRLWIVAYANKFRCEYSPKRQDKVPISCSKDTHRHRGFNQSRVCRMDDDVPSTVDRLKGLGNAIVPQVAYQILKGISEIEK
jgi:DNA (cytosine-5)-methyltransferase 1